MANTSATGGYLIPVTAPDDDDAFLDFLQEVIVGITGLPGDLVRPSYQPDPPLRPAIDVDWCGFYVTNQNAQGHTYLGVNEDGLSSRMVRHEDFELFVRMYGPNCGKMAGMLRDGLELSQNREQLYLAGMSYRDYSGIVKLPELVNELWYSRADITLSMSRELNRDYSVLSFVAAQGLIVTENTTIEWAVGPEV